MKKDVDIHDDNTALQSIPTIIREYNEFMSDFKNTALFSGEWEKRGDSYVQFSFYDESKVGSSAACLLVV